MVAGEERISTDVFEGEFYDRTGRLLCQTATPGGRPQVNSQFKDTSFDLIGTEAGLTGKFMRLGKENRPVLDFVRRGKLNFRAQPLLSFSLRPGATKKARHYGISPGGPGRKESIVIRPMAKSEARSLQEKVAHAESNSINRGIIVTQESGD